MVGVAYADAVLIDTSAAIALVDDDDAFHATATASFEELRATVLLCAVDVTAHESFTRLRYKRTLDAAIRGFELLRAADVRTLRFTEADEARALDLVRKYTDKTLSYHDALCASVMLRHRLFRIFSFDADFWTFGFELVPGATKPRG